MSEHQHVIDTLRSATTFFIAQDKEGCGLALHPSDVLALVDSLQQQVKKLSEYKVSSKQFGELYDKALSVVRQNESNKKKADDNYRALLEETIQLRDQLAEMQRERDRTIAELRETLVILR
ncbi:arginyl-tRNA--protein-N-Asp/Glu arginylyltransferase [Paenibacillus sp. 1182]|uniref:hypothetical protein n=1 Tax=Paenibacillus sp. 1182 TaxID=2806565 RepID=UPI001AE4A92D|nr:hypothetical protein [Paenibacillus sp. 1182]MBP1308801.1 arginyl-tRNA--protein-N-Asp/Glu arginylyltransferase [Paenibacillus sp. 1182]